MDRRASNCDPRIEYFGYSQIYILSTHPTFDVQQARYVGKSRLKLAYRLSRHLADAKTQDNHRSRWIRSQISTGNLIYIHMVAACLNEHENDVEKEVIRAYRKMGIDLTNTTDGGDGIPNMSQEIRDKISKTRKKHYADNPWELEILRIRASMRKASPETRMKMSATRKGRKINIIWPNHPYGPNAKLTESDVLEIRRIYKANVEAGNGFHIVAWLANNFGVSKEGIRRTVARISYAKVL